MLLRDFDIPYYYKPRLVPCSSSVMTFTKKKKFIFVKVIMVIVVMIMLAIMMEVIFMKLSGK